MLTKDFIEAVEELGYEVDTEWPDTLYVETPDVETDTVVAICSDKAEPASWYGGTAIPASDAAALVKLVEEYANTPVEEREEAIATKTLQDYELEELCEAIAKKLLKEYDPNTKVLISQERISFYEPKWSSLSEWASENL
ncbi:hypothetical protein [Enterococcus phage IMEEF1]|uniref:Uncharacterized protein n=1 Tax=Enterococcus phage IMEEF1 TaxID=1351735 RepID=S5MCY3_9CAUD|nr:hypothetical protein FDH83_gp40 [Enterococcus phage IMEEF1]AGR49023.1 hypothetical protein [Enterococcus phage IMEEF1]